jgi:hypothetical protein
MMASCLMAPSGILLDQLRQLDQIIALGHRNPSELPNSTPDQPLTKRVPVLKSAFKAAAKAKGAKEATKAKELKAEAEAEAKAKAKAKAKASKTVPRAESAQLAAARAHGSAVLLKTKDEQSARVSRKTCNEEKSTAAHALQVCAA